jgi:hypothetical protein
MTALPVCGIDAAIIDAIAFSNRDLRSAVDNAAGAARQQAKNDRPLR